MYDLAFETGHIIVNYGYIAPNNRFDTERTGVPQSR